MKEALEVQREKDKVFWEKQEEDRVKKLVEEHRVSLQHSRRLAHMLADRDVFLDRLKSARSSEIQKKLNDFMARLEVERKARLQKRKEQRRKERSEAYYQQKEEEEQLRRDEELKKQREEEERMEIERSKQEEEILSRRKGEMDRHEEQRNHSERNGEVENADKSGPWRPRGTSNWRQKEQEKLDEWRLKEERVPLSERLASRDIRRDEPIREKQRT
ncbi:UNVERIFIED_CONTAM: hypothetical protein GTU68_025942, partial [Idotea baltica]|nr:hypothetical protein [Idotea baltica]